MFYDTTKESPKNVVEWLEGSNQAGWEDLIGTGEEVLSEIEHMARPIYRPDRTGSFGEELPIDNPFAENLNGATPEVRSMLRAMRMRNRAAALEHGRAALAVM
jgi:hypothetical protein